MKDDREAIRIGVARRPTGAEYPGCGRRSKRIRGSYVRLPADLPSAVRRVALRLRAPPVRQR
ncbi:transposase family protein [Streptomyces huiliensis]|uniref:transposase family protein n=1 Tax=Streptomyces huiliensis TaxID=2876027 RepID=UPI001CC002CC|nr:transposase family protein [Streptomyces huiliensis]